MIIERLNFEGRKAALPDTGFEVFHTAEALSVLDYGQALLNARIEPASEIEAGPNEEVVSIEDHGTHTAVVKRHDCATGCDECPHGPYLYHVRSEKQITGGEKLHWTYTGEVEETCTS